MRLKAETPELRPSPGVSRAPDRRLPTDRGKPPPASGAAALARRRTSHTSARPLALVFGLALSALAGACAAPSGGPPPEQAERYAGSMQIACSPVDAQGVGFELQPQGGAQLPRLSIGLWPDRPLAAGQRLRLRFQDEGYAAAHVSGTEWTQAVDGELGIEAYLEQERAAGWIRLELSDGSRLEGWFEAEWLDQGPAFCG